MSHKVRIASPYKGERLSIKSRSRNVFNFFSLLILVAIVFSAAWSPSNSVSAQKNFDATVTETPTAEPTVETTPLVETTPQPEVTPTSTPVPTLETVPSVSPTETPVSVPTVVEEVEQQINSESLNVTFMAPSNWNAQINALVSVPGYKNVKAIILSSPEQSDQFTVTALSKKTTLSLTTWIKAQKARFPVDVQIVSLDESAFGYPASAAFGQISSGISTLYIFIDRGKDVLEISYQSSSDFSFLSDFAHLAFTLNPGDSAILKENRVEDFAGIFDLAPAQESDMVVLPGEELQALAYTSCAGQSAAGSAQDAAFFSGVLNKMNIPDTQFARDAFMAWKPYENTTACWNPLATTYQVAWFPSGTGCSETMFNSVGVRNYSSKDCGQLGTARTLLYSGSGSYYKPIRDMLSQTSFNWQAVHDSIKKWVGSEAYATSITNKWQALWNNRSIAKCSVPSGQFCGEFYNNRTLSGNPVLAQNTGSINFNWGSGAPGSGVGSDNFSARWQGVFSFENANYIFTATADDGIRVYIDNALKSPSSPAQDTWRDQSTTTYTYNIPLSAGNHTVKVEYYENSGGAISQVSWQKRTYGSTWVSQSPYPTVSQGGSADLWVTYKNMGNTTWYNTYSPNRTHLGTLNPTTGAIDFVSPFVCTPGWVGNNRPAILSESSVAPGGNGTFRFKICVPPNLTPGVYRIAVAPLVEMVSWMKSPQFVYWDITVKGTGCSAPSGQFCGEYFNNRYLTGSPSYIQNTSNINFNWGSGAPGSGIASDNFSARWQGVFSFESANYIFTVTADDGIRVYIDNALKSPSSPAQNPWRDQSTTIYSYDIPLSAGNHTVKVEYYENSGGAISQVSWQKKVVINMPDVNAARATLRTMSTMQSPWRQVDAPIKSVSSSRSNIMYTAVIEQFDVASANFANRYKGGTVNLSDTRCNIFAGDVMRAMGAPIPTKGNLGVGASGSQYTDPMTANAPHTNDFLNGRRTSSDAANNGWRRIDPTTASGLNQLIAHVGAGKPALVSNSGHIAVIRPNQSGVTSWGNLLIAQAGAKLFLSGTLSSGFGVGVLPQFFIHD